MEHLQEAQASGVTLNEDALWLLQMYTFANDNYGEWENYNKWNETSVSGFSPAPYLYLSDNSLYHDFLKLFGGYEDMEISYPVVEDFIDNSSNVDVLGDEAGAEMLTAAETQKTASEEFMSGVAEFRSALAAGITVYVKGQSYGTYESGVHGGRATNMADRVMMVK